MRRQESASRLSTPATQLDELDRGELEHRFHVLLQRYKDERLDKEKLVKCLRKQESELTNSTQRSADEQRTLQLAHIQQAEVLRKLQAENAKLLKCRSTMEDQELVIIKLEDLLESAVRKPAAPAAPDLELEFKLSQAQLTIQQLEAQLRNSSSARSNNDAQHAQKYNIELEREAARWRSEAEILQTRVTEIEGVLEATGAEMARLQMDLKIKETQLEAASTGSFYANRFDGPPSPYRPSSPYGPPSPYQPSSPYHLPNEYGAAGRAPFEAWN